MKATLHIDRPSHLWRWGGIAGLAVVCVAAAIYFLGGEDAPTDVTAAVSPTATPATRAMPPTEFPRVKLALIETQTAGEPRQAVIDIAGQRRTLTPGQELTHGIRLNTIENDHVVLAFAGSTRILWGAVQGKPDDEGGSGPDIRERNRHIEVARLTASRPMMADTFLREVLVQANPRGGYEVVSVTPGSMYDKMGVLPGDVIYTLDTPKMAAVDEGSMIALMQQTEIELDVHRKGAQIRLRHALNVDEPAASATR